MKDYELMWKFFLALLVSVPFCIVLAVFSLLKLWGIEISWWVPLVSIYVLVVALVIGLFGDWGGDI